MKQADLIDAMKRALQELEKENNKSMTRKEQIEQASVEYLRQKKPVAIAGAEWDDTAYRTNINKAFVDGTEWAYEQMMKDSEHAEIGYFNQRGLSIYLDTSLEKLGFSEGDRVKIIIVKED